MKKTHPMPEIHSQSSGVWTEREESCPAGREAGTRQVEGRQLDSEKRTRSRALGRTSPSDM